MVRYKLLGFIELQDTIKKTFYVVFKLKLDENAINMTSSISLICSKIKTFFDIIVTLKNKGSYFSPRLNSYGSSVFIFIFIFFSIQKKARLIRRPAE